MTVMKFVFFSWLTCVLTAGVLSARLPAGFLEKESVQSTRVRAGLMWHAVKGNYEGMKLELHLLEIDPADANFSLSPIVGGESAGIWGRQFFLRSRPSRFLEDFGLIAVLNASFFDIRGTQSPTGLLIRDGVLLREPHSSRVALLFLKDDSLALAQPGWEGEVIVARGSIPAKQLSGENVGNPVINPKLGDVVDGNSVLGSNRVSDTQNAVLHERIPLLAVNHPEEGKNGVAMYLPPWIRTLGVDASFLENSPAYELVLKREGLQLADQDSEWTVMNGTVVELRERQSSRRLEADEFVLVPYGEENVEKLRRSVGDRVQVRWRLTGLPEGVANDQIRDSISAGPVLISKGETQTGSGGFWTTRHPRSAIGWSQQQGKIWLLLVDGRSNQSAGMSLYTLAKYFEHLQVTEALNLDGGGSSALAVALPSGAGVRVVNRPSDGRERYVPTAIGLRPK